jgi:multimeric flavodoxin WrbA
MSAHRNTQASFDYTGLRAVFINCTLLRSPHISAPQALIEASADLMREQGVHVETLRAIDHDIATGAKADMTEHGWATDAWPALFGKVRDADILVIADPGSLGGINSVTTRILERLAACAGELTESGQSVYYGKAGGAVIHGQGEMTTQSAARILSSLTAMGCTIPPAAASFSAGTPGMPSLVGWSDASDRSMVFMTWNLMHLAAILKANGGIPAYGNLPGEWAKGERFGFDLLP